MLNIFNVSKPYFLITFISAQAPNSQELDFIIYQKEKILAVGGVADGRDVAVGEGSVRHSGAQAAWRARLKRHSRRATNTVADMNMMSRVNQVSA